MTILRELLSAPRGSKRITEKVLYFHVTLSVVIILGLLAAMTFTAYAYFSTDLTVPNNRIQAAVYELEVEVTEDGAPVTLTDNSFTISAGKTYVVTLNRRVGDAGAGFCNLLIAGQSFHTAPIGADASAPNGRRDTLTFTMDVRGNGTALVELLSHWGTSIHYTAYSGVDIAGPYYITNEEVLELGLLPEGLVDLQTESFLADGTLVYTVQAGDILSNIAARYGTSAERIAAYNELENADEIYAGQKLKIPPEDWVMPTVYSSDTPDEQPSDGAVKEPENKTEEQPKDPAQEESSVTEGDPNSQTPPVTPDSTDDVPTADSEADGLDPSVETDIDEATTSTEGNE